MTQKIVNKKVKGCPICQNTYVSSIVDPLIFSCQVRLKDLVVNLETRDIYLDEDVLKEHWSHVFAMDEDDALSAVLTIDPEATNLQSVKKTLAKIEIVENNMLISGQEDNKLFLDLLKRKQEFLTLKAKLEGEINENVSITIPEWIKKVPPKTIDVEYRDVLPESTD